jgi:hypothetical protein
MRGAIEPRDTMFCTWDPSQVFSRKLVSGRREEKNGKRRHFPLLSFLYMSHNYTFKYKGHVISNSFFLLTIIMWNFCNNF